MVNLKQVTLAGAAALLLGAPLPAAAAEEPPYPVWWSESLEIESLDRIGTRLELKLSPHFPDGFPLFRHEGDTWEADTWKKVIGDAVLWAVNADDFLPSKADCEVWQAGAEWFAENP